MSPEPQIIKIEVFTLNEVEFIIRVNNKIVKREICVMEKIGQLLGGN